MENNKNIAENWIAKHLSGETTSTEEAQLQQWIAESPANEKLYLDLKKVNHFGKQHYDTHSLKPQDIDVQQEWNQFLQNTSNVKGVKTVSLAPTTNRVTRILKFAAAVLLLLGIGMVINYFSEKSAPIVYQTTANTQEVALPDGSIVTLNKHSTLSYSESFGVADRSLSLSGEAFFDVTKDKEKPFIISTQKAQVQVLGTSFNVRAYEESELSEVVVTTGVVKFSKNNSAEAVTLKAGDKGVLRSDQLINKVNEDVNFLAWKTRKLIFEEESLGSVIATLNQTYQANISTRIDIPECAEVTVTFEQQTIEAILNVLKTTLDLEYKTDGDKIEITAIGC